MAIKLASPVRRVREFGGLTLVTTGLPMAFAAEVSALANAGAEEHQKWLASRFLEALSKCVFVAPEGDVPKSVAGLEGVDGSELDMESVSELFLFACGIEGASRPLAPSGRELPSDAPVPSHD